MTVKYSKDHEWIDISDHEAATVEVDEQRVRPGGAARIPERRLERALGGAGEVAVRAGRARAVDEGVVHRRDGERAGIEAALALAAARRVGSQRHEDAGGPHGDEQGEDGEDAADLHGRVR